MSDYLTGLLNSFMGIGPRARPRDRLRFEPETGSTPLTPCESCAEDWSADEESETPSASLFHSTMNDLNPSEGAPVSVPQSTPSPVHPSFPGPAPEVTKSPGYFSREILGQEIPPRISPPTISPPQGTRAEAAPPPKKPGKRELAREKNQGRVGTGRFGKHGPTGPEPDRERIYIYEEEEKDAGYANEGMMEAPSWLPARQKEIRTRWIVNEPPARPESVVNVTIGRIEVRAARSAEQEQESPPHREKPSGVMTLDQYLGLCAQGGKP